jgi:hypothetical protein
MGFGKPHGRGNQSRAIKCEEKADPPGRDASQGVLKTGSSPNIPNGGDLSFLFERLS